MQRLQIRWHDLSQEFGWCIVLLWGEAEEITQILWQEFFLILGALEKARRP